MVAVTLSRSLRQDLGDEISLDLATKFREFKIGQTSFGLHFGRDKPFGWPAEVVAQQIWHVHLEDAACSASWDYFTDNYVRNGYTQENYTSDTILVYGRLWDAHRAPFLLHEILAPDGHMKMDDRLRMRAIAAGFADERRDYAAAMPCSDWIIVG